MNDRNEPGVFIPGEKAGSHVQDTGKDHRGPTRTEATMKRHARGPDRLRLSHYARYKRGYKRNHLSWLGKFRAVEANGSRYERP